MSRCGYTVGNVYERGLTWQCSQIEGHVGPHHFGVANEYLSLTQDLDRLARIRDLAAHYRSVSASPKMYVPLAELEAILNA